MKYILLSLLAASFSVHAQTKYKVETLVSQNDTIWGFDFFPDGNMIFTERSGKLYSFDSKNKKVILIQGTPKVHAVGQGGLLDVRVHPNNGYIYFTYSEPLGSQTSATTLARAKILNNKLIDFKKLFMAQQKSSNDYHYGSRIEFDGKGHLFITSGERGERESIPKLNNHLGKIIRLNDDGSIPNDNPYIADKNAKPEIWSHGIRSPQGLAMRPGTDELWEAEMGPKGGDEINIIEPKKDYGWPIVTYGTEYEGPKIGEGHSKMGVEEPVTYWVPSISPSGLAFYTGNKMPEWQGNIFLALLSGQHIRRLTLNGKKVIAQEELFKDLNWRFRNVRTGPDGYLWFSTDEGKIGRIVEK
jgi:glucose/arabinose dehydrogenase